MKISKYKTDFQHPGHRQSCRSNSITIQKIHLSNYTHRCTIHEIYSQNTTHSIQAFIIFIFIYKQVQLQGLKHKIYLSLSNTYPATIYVAATFHPTIGQCAHQSLSNTATPELGMISPRNKEHQQATKIQEYNKKQPSQHSWVYQARNKQANILMGLSN